MDLKSIKTDIDEADKGTPSDSLTPSAHTKLIATSVYLNKAEAAFFLRVSRRTLDAWMARRLVSYIRIGRTVRFRRSDLEQNTGVFFASRSRPEEMNPFERFEEAA